MKSRFLICLMGTVVAFLGQGLAQGQLLGRISFPNSGAEQAQSDFIEGVLYLHNFEYEDAARAFRRAQEIDPDFALAYWGEAMTHNHPLWSQQDRAAALAVLARLAPTPAERAAKAGSDRERGYLDAVELLYGTGEATENLSKNERDVIYRDAMRRHSAAYPADHEAVAFYALSILGTAHEGRDFATYMQAAAVAQGVWDANRKHPGAAHYLIHSFDDPVHAPLGLPMARVYSEIAPAAAHAQHMTSHIFVAMGMWDDVVEANEIARRVQTTRQAEFGQQLTVCGHYPYWLLYGYLQQGRMSNAAKVLDTCQERFNSGPTQMELWHFRAMRARYAIDSEDWSSLDRWNEGQEGGISGPGAERTLFARAYSAWRQGELESLRGTYEELQGYEPPEAEPEDAALAGITRLEVEALLALETGDTERSIDLLRQAVSSEHELPYAFGPPQLAKPASELLGEVLAAEGRWSESRKAYSDQLARTPERAASMSGFALAAGKLGDRSAAEEVSRRLARNMRNADR